MPKGEPDIILRFAFPIETRIGDAYKGGRSSAAEAR